MGMENLDANCPGCGKRLTSLKDWEKHLKKCKLFKLQELAYNIPIVPLEDIYLLEAKQLSNAKDWGVWNHHSHDWIRDKNGQIDSRVFPQNANTFLNSLIANSIQTNANKTKPPKSELS